MLIAAKSMMSMAPAKKLSAKSYVQNGLIAMWDGIENAGWGIHDPNATVWKDLTGDNDATFNSIYACRVLDDCVKFNYETGSSSTGYAKMLYAIPTFAVIEMCIRKMVRAVNANDCTICTPSNARYNGFGISDNNGMLSDTNDGKASRCSVAIPYEEKVSLSFHMDIPAALCDRCFLNGESRNDGIIAAGNRFNRASSGEIGGSGGLTNMFVYNIRIYNSALSDADVIYNYKIDKARFNLPDVN